MDATISLYVFWNLLSQYFEIAFCSSSDVFLSINRYLHMILCGWVLTLLNIVTVDPDAWLDAAVVDVATDMDVGYTAVVNNCPGVGLLLPGGCCNLYRQEGK